jgi:ABC-2 type transport system permease protein
LVNFMKLVQNENMKIYQRARTWIMLGIVCMIPILISLLFYITMSGEGATNWEVMSLESLVLIVLITIFAAVMAADSVAGEFTWGTIKLLLIRPWSRSMILLSKFVSLVLFALFFMIVAYVFTFIVNILFFGYTNSPDAAWNTTLLYLYQFISLIFVVSFAFMLSAAFRSGGLAIGLSVFLLFGGSIINGMLAAFSDKPWVQYVPFLHINLYTYLEGGAGPLPGHPMTLGFSLAVIAGYFILFNAVSWLVFCKRDVAA